MNANFIMACHSPAAGFGVYQIPPEEIALHVSDALEVGYRPIDTAASYFNERQVGGAIRESGLKREELFIATNRVSKARMREKTWIFSILSLQKGRCPPLPPWTLASIPFMTIRILRQRKPSAHTGFMTEGVVGTPALIIPKARPGRKNHD